MQRIVGSLLWISQSTRPDISTITNILSSYQTKPTLNNINAAKRATTYLLNTKEKGISFSSIKAPSLKTYQYFPTNQSQIFSMTDSNWGPQDQSKPNHTVKQELELFKTRLISGYLIMQSGGPIAWASKRQKITAHSMAEAEIYATDEAVKLIIHIQNIRNDLKFNQDNHPIPIFNDNQACVTWSKKTATKGLRHIQIRENSIQENIQSLLENK
mmetsp:Transcript_12383/g.17655  ORF Transcript_12383/g.17655 Transcript_12383/m.17655 type:complete len:214 (+) Transcript_12383:3276-3917(+)